MDNQSSDDDRTVWVGNIHSKVTEEILWELFLQAGPLQSVKIPKDFKTGKQKSFAFVKFHHQVSVPYVIELMNGLCLYKTPLKLDYKNKPGNTQESVENGYDNTPKRRKMNDETEHEYHQTPPDMYSMHMDRNFHGYPGTPNNFHPGMFPYLMSPFPMQRMPMLRQEQMPRSAPRERPLEGDSRYRRPDHPNYNGEERPRPERRRSNMEMHRSHSSPYHLHEEERRSDRRRDHPEYSHSHRRR